ncbi:hypothetical protein ACFL5T_05665 [Gemmatimonadota bacterium]
MRRSLFLPVLFLALGVPNATAQDELLQSGPMLGYSDMFEVLVWAQTTAPADVKLVYWDLESPQARMETETVATTKADGYAAKMIADQVQPGRRYGYELHINDANVARPYRLEFQTQVLWQYRTDPPASVTCSTSASASKVSSDMWTRRWSGPRTMEPRRRS